MTISLEIQNLSNSSSVPKHQSIGKHGSFWLPKNSSEFKHQGSTNPKSVDGKSSSSAKFSNSKQVAGNQSQKSIDLPKPSFEKSILTAEKKISPQPKSLPSSMRKSSTSPLIKPVIPKVPHLPILSNNVKVSQVNANSAVSVASAKEQIKTTLFNNSPRQTVDRDASDQDHGKKKKNHGTKNAFSTSGMDTIDKDTSQQASSVACSSVVNSTSVSKFVDLICKSVAPRVAYTNKSNKKIVRFAIDLPNGSKLGVRLEKTEKGVSLCFIAPDETTRELLNFCKNGIKNKIESDESFQTNVYVFTDYKEMDDYFLKAA
ncbi:MAG: hypothetical protein HN548_13060 [Opitutae bacterium]|nr:hypothetical protein [Opitutae bacterium]MBT5717021.1 hypothetical protein [Opitutae bacterium]